MKYVLTFKITMLFLFIVGCGTKEIQQDVDNLSVEFSWEGMKSCDWGNPEINIGGIPAKTKFLIIDIKDIAYHDRDSSTLKIPYDGNGMIPKGKYKEMKTPCPGLLPGTYELTIEAIDENELVIGVGREKRSFPENG